MMNYGYPYNMFNVDYMRARQAEQAEARRQWEQNKNIGELTKTLSDFLDLMMKVHPDYQIAAQNACASVLLEHMAKNSMERQQ